MAANNSKEVDLIIRAKDMSAQALKDAKKAIDEVTSALSGQGKQAKATGDATDALGRSASSLADTEKTLAKSSDTLSKALDSTAAAIDRAAERETELERNLDRANERLNAHKQTVSAAALAYQIFSRNILEVGPPTKQMAAQLDKLSNTAQGNTRDMDRLSRAVEKTQGDLYNARQNTENLTRSLAELRQLEGEVATTSAQVSRTMQQQAAATDASAAATDRLNARMKMAQANGAAMVAEGRKQADIQAQAAAAQAKGEQQAFNARLARIRAAAQAQAAAVSKDLSSQSAAAGTRAATAAEAAANAERAKSVGLLDKLTTGNRESLSWYQRVRGELIALATAYVGLQGAISLAASSLDALRKYNTNESILSVVAGSNDPTKVGQQYEYARAQAERLGMRIDDLTQSYGKFAVSAKLAGATSNQTRYIFERVAEAGRVLHLSNDDLTGTFIALEQMMSKGQIMTEELRNQLGNRIPGAFELMAKGMNITLPELNKRLKEGSVGVKELLGFSQQLAATYSTQLPGAMNNLTAVEARLYNAFFEFRKLIADQGFGEAWTKFAADLTKLLKSEDGKAYAKGLSDAFTKVLDILKFLVDNITAVGDALALVFGVKVLASLGAFVVKLTEAAFLMQSLGATASAAAPQVAAAGAAMGGASVQADNLARALSAINRIFLILTAAFTGWEIGKILGEKFEFARLAGTAAAESIYEAWIKVKYGVLILASEMTETVVGFFDKGLRKIGELKNGFLGGLRSTASFLGLDTLADNIGKGITDGVKTGAEQSKATLAAATAALKGQRDKELADNKAAFDTLYQNDLRRRGALLARTPTQATQLTDTTGGLYDMPGKEKKDKNADRIANMEKSISESVNQLWREIEKGESDSLDKRLQAVRRHYKNIQDEIAKFQKIGGRSIDGKSISDVQAELAQIEQTAIKQETLKFNTEQLKKKEQEVNDVIKERADYQKDIEEQVKAQTMSAVDGFAKIAAQAEKTQPKIAQMAKDAAAFANGVRGTGIPDARIDAFISKMTRVGNGTASGPASDAAQGGLSLFNQQMAETNNKLNERNSLVTMYNDLVKLGAITQDDANEKIKKAFEETTPQIKNMVVQMQALLDQMEAAGDISGTKLDALNAKLKEISVQAQYVDKDAATLRDTFTKGFGQGVTQQLGNVVDQLLAAADGTQKWSDSFRNILSSFGQFIAQFLRQMADAIMQIYATKAAMSLLGMVGLGGGAAASGTGLGTWGLGANVPAAIAHSGAIVGQPGGTSRNAAASWFAAAPRYHSGTVVGLAADEQAAILQKGEEVLSKDNPRNIMNLAAKNAAQAKSGVQSIRNVLVTDPNFVPDAMSSAEGEKTLITMITRNRVGFKQALGV